MQSPGAAEIELLGSVCTIRPPRLQTGNAGSKLKTTKDKLVQKQVFKGTHYYVAALYDQFCEVKEEAKENPDAVRKLRKK